MTDKTIINGVDVSGCENYVLRVRYDALWDLNSKFHTCKHKTLCSDNTNCYFKQSARKDERIRGLEQKLSQIAALSAEVIAVGSDNYFGFLIQAVKTTAIIKQIKQIAQGE